MRDISQVIRGSRIAIKTTRRDENGLKFHSQQRFARAEYVFGLIWKS
jgi:hypothetical protein